jgi:hypothetical protein
MEKITRQEALEIAVERYVDGWDMDDLLNYAFESMLRDYMESSKEQQDELFENANVIDDFIIE